MAVALVDCSADRQPVIRRLGGPELIQVELPSVFFDQGTYIDVSGTFEGDTASGTAELGTNPDETCFGTWMATPSN